MSIIYEPSGKAREYSPLAANFYDGCDHGCQYCYAPGIRRRTRDDYANIVTPRRNILQELEKDATKYRYSKKQVLFNFMGDPYCKANDVHKITRGALTLMLEQHIPVAILTKGGTRACQDFDIMSKFGEHIKIGSTLTTLDEKTSREWEPGAALPLDRLEMLKNAKQKGIKTWASFEPVIHPDHALDVLKESLFFVDEYKIGKINNYPAMVENIDWTAFLLQVVDILRKENKPFYIKYDLRQAAPTIKLYGNECLADEHCVKPWDELVLL